MCYAVRLILPGELAKHAVSGMLQLAVLPGALQALPCVILTF